VKEFKWSAKDQSGRLHKGEMNAKTLSEVRIELRRRGFRQVEAKEIKPFSLFGTDPAKEKAKQREKKRKELRRREAEERKNLRLEQKNSRSSKKSKKSALDLEITWGPFGDIPEKDLLIWFKKLSTMTRSGLSIIDALTLCWDQSKGNMKRVGGEILDAINGGASLSEAMGAHQRHFDSIYLNLIEAGEATGELDKFLDRVVAMMERRKAIKSGIKSALFYPVTVVLVTIGITIFMLTNVVPIFQKMFEGLGGELPAPTQFLVDASEFLTGGGLLYLFGGALGIFLLDRLFTSGVKEYKRLKAGLVLKLPIFGDIIMKSSVAQIALLMGNLFAAGVSVVEILAICSKASTNILFREAVERVGDEVVGGHPLSSLFAEETVFPQDLGQLLKVGEETGNMEEMLNSIAKYYQEEFDAVVDGLSSVIEPLMIVIVGGVIGGLIFAMYMPIFQAGDLVKG